MYEKAELHRRHDATPRQSLARRILSREFCAFPPPLIHSDDVHRLIQRCLLGTWLTRGLHDYEEYEVSLIVLYTQEIQ